MTGKCLIQGGVAFAKAITACVTHPTILHLEDDSLLFLHAGLKSNVNLFIKLFTVITKGKDPLLHIVLAKPYSS